MPKFGGKMALRSIEDYLKTIYYLSENGKSASTTDISRTLKISPASVTEMLKKIDEKGYITHSPYHGTRLTSTGRGIAEKIVRKHRLLERFLHDVLKIDKVNVHDQACGMEHSFSDEAAEALCRFLKHPDRCPDNGKTIPPCDLKISSCVECLALHGKGLEAPGKNDQKRVPVGKLKENQCGNISLIRGGYNLLNRLSNMGLKPGTKICAVRVTPPSGPVEVLVGSSKIVLGKAIASKVFIDLKETS